MKWKWCWLWVVCNCARAHLILIECCLPIQTIKAFFLSLPWSKCTWITFMVFGSNHHFNSVEAKINSIAKVESKREYLLVPEQHKAISRISTESRSEWIWTGDLWLPGPMVNRWSHYCQPTSFLYRVKNKAQIRAKSTRLAFSFLFFSLQCNSLKSTATMHISSFFRRKFVFCFSRAFLLRSKFFGNHKN